MLLSAGTHITIDAYVRDSAVFTVDGINELFQEIVTALDMKILFGPHTIEVPVDPEALARVQKTGVFEDEGGLTGICVINTSHLSLHSWPLQNFFSMDVFSCCDFDPPVALAIIRKRLDVVQEDVHILRRRKPQSWKNRLARFWKITKQQIVVLASGIPSA